MYRKIAFTALALSFASPAFANDDFARSLNVEPGKYTLSELVQIKLASDKAAEMEAIERRRQAHWRLHEKEGQSN